jgi:hypothetical protein
MKNANACGRHLAEGKGNAPGRSSGQPGGQAKTVLRSMLRSMLQHTVVRGPAGIVNRGDRSKQAHDRRVVDPVAGLSSDNRVTGCNRNLPLPDVCRARTSFNRVISSDHFIYPENHSSNQCARQYAQPTATSRSPGSCPEQAGSRVWLDLAGTGTELSRRMHDTIGRAICGKTRF